MIATFYLAASRSAWCAKSFRVARSTARLVSTEPTASISPIDSTTTSTIATNRFVRSVWRRFTVLRSYRLVPGPANGADQLGASQLAAKLGDVHIDRAGSPGICHPPDAVEQLVAADHDARILE